MLPGRCPLGYFKALPGCPHSTAKGWIPLKMERHQCNPLCCALRPSQSLNTRGPLFEMLLAGRGRPVMAEVKAAGWLVTGQPGREAQQAPRDCSPCRFPAPSLLPSVCIHIHRAVHAGRELRVGNAEFRGNDLAIFMGSLGAHDKDSHNITEYRRSWGAVPSFVSVTEELGL